VTGGKNCLEIAIVLAIFVGRQEGIRTALETSTSKINLVSKEAPAR